MRLINNQIIIDLSKVQYAYFFYKNQYGNTVFKLGAKRSSFSVRGEWYLKTDIALPHPDYPNETLFKRAKRLGIIDNWVPHARFQLTANHSLVYSGEKANSIYKEYCRRIFKKNK